LFALGPEALSDSELLSILFGTGVRGEPVHAMAARVLAAVGGPGGLPRAERGVLAAMCGPARAASVVAALELGRRAVHAMACERPVIGSAQDAAQLLHPRLAHLEREQSMVLLLDRKHRVLTQSVVGFGGIAHAPMAPREVCAAALREPGVAAVLVAHNHPSGDPEPSGDDVRITRRLAEAASVVGLEFVDHIIVAARGWISLRSEGW
jgi:DNA repair protein RadC